MTSTMDARRDSKASDPPGWQRLLCHTLTIVNVVLVVLVALFGLFVRWHFRKMFADFGTEPPVITHWIYVVSDLGWAVGSCLLLGIVVGKEFAVGPIRTRLLLNIGLLGGMMCLIAYFALAIGLPWMSLVEKLS